MARFDLAGVGCLKIYFAGVLYIGDLAGLLYNSDFIRLFYNGDFKGLLYNGDLTGLLYNGDFTGLLFIGVLLTGDSTRWDADLYLEWSSYIDTDLDFCTTVTLIILSS